MSGLNKFLKWIYFVYAFSIFTIVMLVIFPFVIIASFLPRIVGGNITYRLCMIWGDIVFALIFIPIKFIYEAPHDKRTPYIFVTNHISYLDACLIVKAIRQPLRVLAKIEMTKIPVFGFIYKNVVVTVDRSNASNRAKSIMILKSLIKKGISVLIFPEGTFNKTHKPLKDFYDGAFRIAIETQTPIKPILFLDNYDRMNYTSFLSLNPGKARVVYMQEIPVTGYTVHDVKILRQKVFQLMENKLISYKASWIKSSDESKLQDKLNPVN